MDDISTPSFIAVQWLIWAAATFLLALRLYMRIRMRQGTYWLSDSFLGLGLLLLTSYSITLTFYKLYEGQVVLNWLGFQKLQYALDILFGTGLYFARFSFLAFYDKIFPATEVWLRRALILVAVYNVACFIITAFVDAFWCADVSTNWLVWDLVACIRRF